MPVASLQALLANINRDPKRGKVFGIEDFQIFRRKEEAAARLSAEVAAAALSLRRENKAPPILLAIWPEILASAGEEVSMPSTRAFVNDEKTVWVLCPAFDGSQIRGGLVCVSGCVHGLVTLRDIDRPLARYTVSIPKRPLASWIEAGLLLKTER